MRKQARLLENEIDLKLVAFSKIGSSSGSTMGHSSNATDTAPLLGEHVFDSLSEEIAQMLDKVMLVLFCKIYSLCGCNLRLPVSTAILYQ